MFSMKLYYLRCILTENVAQCVTLLQRAYRTGIIVLRHTYHRNCYKKNLRFFLEFPCIQIVQHPDNKGSDKDDCSVL